MSIKKVICCCGAGVASSYIVQMNACDILNNAGIGEVEVQHAAVSDIKECIADLFIVSKDLSEFIDHVGKDNMIVLENIIDKHELQEKLSLCFGF